MLPLGRARSCMILTALTLLNKARCPPPAWTPTANRRVWLKQTIGGALAAYCARRAQRPPLGTEPCARCRRPIADHRAAQALVASWQLRPATTEDLAAYVLVEFLNPPQI